MLAKILKDKVDLLYKNGRFNKCQSSRQIEIDYSKLKIKPEQKLEEKKTRSVKSKNDAKQKNESEKKKQLRKIGINRWQLTAAGRYSRFLQ